MTYYTRKDWGARDPEPGPGFLNPPDVRGIALHWPGANHRWTTPNEVMSALREWQRMHMDTNGWSDIAYQNAIDQRGNVYKLRGLRKQSAANGDQDVNQHYGALLLVVGIGEEPSEHMIRSVRHRIALFRDHFHNARLIVPHSAIRPEPTQCPGDKVRSLIDSGKFNPQRKA